MAASIKDYVLSLVTEQPGLSNDKVAELVRIKFKSNTTAASVSSIKSNAKKSGELDASTSTIALEVDATPVELPEDSDEPEEQIAARLAKRFAALDRMVAGVIKGTLPALIVSGPPGIGKSYGLTKALEDRAAKDEDFQYDVISGSISAVGLYIALWNMREGGVIVLDDCDDVFRDETTLNLLKVALDSNAKRVLSWRKQAQWLEDLGIEDRFEFQGQIVFLTNLDFEAMSESGKMGAKHFKALIDRSMYLGLSFRSLKDNMVRIKQVVHGTSMLAKYGLGKEEVKEIMEFVEENRKRFHNLSLRLVHQIALSRIADPENWKEDIEMAKMRNA